MSATNHTSNYNLNQFIGTDKPSWLVDYNGDMLAIDTAMKANQTAAGNAQSKADTADGKADTNALAITTLDNQINTPSTGLASVVAGHTIDISGINGKIGNIVLPTTAQTITGAIAEIDGNTDTIDSKIGNTILPTTAQTITGAIDELNSEKLDSAWSGYSSQNPILNNGTYDASALVALAKSILFRIIVKTGTYANYSHEWVIEKFTSDYNIIDTFTLENGMIKTVLNGSGTFSFSCTDTTECSEIYLDIFYR